MRIFHLEVLDELWNELELLFALFLHDLLYYPAHLLYKFNRLLTCKFRRVLDEGRRGVQG